MGIQLRSKICSQKESIESLLTCILHKPNVATRLEPFQLLQGILHKGQPYLQDLENFVQTSWTSWLLSQLLFTEPIPSHRSNQKQYQNIIAGNGPGPKDLFPEKKKLEMSRNSRVSLWFLSISPPQLPIKLYKKKQPALELTHFSATHQRCMEHSAAELISPKFVSTIHCLVTRKRPFDDTRMELVVEITSPS